MCMIFKKKDLKLKHSRQLQSKIVNRTSEKTLKKAVFARNDKGLAKLANIACQTLLFVSVSVAMGNQRTLLLGREQ